VAGNIEAYSTGSFGLILLGFTVDYVPLRIFRAFDEYIVAEKYKATFIFFAGHYNNSFLEGIIWWVDPFLQG